MGYVPIRAEGTLKIARGTNALETLIGFVILILAAFPVVAIVALVMAIGARDRIRRLETQLAAIGAQLAAGGPTAASAAAETPRAQPEIRPEPIPTAIAEPIAPPQPAAAEPEPSAPSVTAPEPPAAEPGFEERFGTRWVVRIGGLALALGGIFLARYAIEAGVIGPVALGALLAACLIVAGEWTRRQEAPASYARVPSAHIPAILTAAGTTVAYASVYAAYGAYGFLTAAAAFVLLGLVALLTLAAALLHGPALAALGLIGAFVTPLLVSTDVPNYWALYVYLAVVSAAAFVLARIRMWRWLAIAGVAFGTLWMFPGIIDHSVDALTPHAFHAVAGFALVAALIVAGLLFGPEPAPGRIDGVSSGALAAYAFAAAMLVIASRHDGLALMVFAALVAATVAIAWRTEAATAAVPAVGVLAALVIAHWAVETRVDTLIWPAGPAAGLVPEPPGPMVGWHLTLGAEVAALFAASGFLAQGRSESARARPVGPMLWAASAVAAPIAILVALYYRISGLERSIPFAALALLLAAIYAVATEALTRRPPRPGHAAACAIFATGSTAALALTLTFALDKGWLTVGLALMVPGIAWIGRARPLPMLRFVAAAIVVLVVLRVGFEPRIAGSDVGTRPIFNWLLYGYGAPALAFWVGGHLLRRRADDVPARMVDSAAILFTVLLFFLELRHLMNDGDVYAAGSSLAELALQVALALALTIGLERVRGRTRSIVHDIGALAIGALAALGIVLGLWIVENPLVTGADVGGLIVNQILLGYGLNAVLTATLALVARGTRPLAYRIVAAILAVGLALAYFTLEVTRIYHGPVLTVGPTSNAEQYTYSAVWLVFGVVLLLVGIWLRSQPARLASAAVVLITVLKVFVVDLANLGGIYRALSFIGLGVVLVGIGLLYQRLLFPPRRPAPSATAPAGPAA